MAAFILCLFRGLKAPRGGAVDTARGARRAARRAGASQQQRRRAATLRRCGHGPGAPNATLLLSVEPVSWTPQAASLPRVLIERPSLLVTWLRCRSCQRGYFTGSAPSPQPCPACADGRLQPVALWDVRTAAVPPGMLRREHLERSCMGRLSYEPLCPVS